ncbi:MAG: peptide ABC transporter substrate-binding protein [Burkholderiales bacterium]|nr:peptide ABC transporter substrate-binding protein [Burkholderiales bacterium]
MINNDIKKISVLALVVVILFGGCNKLSKAPSSQGGPDHKNTLIVDVGSETPTLDPQLAEDVVANRIMNDLFAGLVDYDQQNNIIPGMASSWDISPDKKIYIFHLRNGLKFSDGSPITAHDFVYSWQRLVNPKTASPYGFILSKVVNAEAIMQGKLPPDKLGAIATNNNTFVVYLTNVDPAFIRSLSLMNVAVVPQKVIEKYGKKWTSPDNMVTSGAYTLKEHVVNGYILAQKNPYFYASQYVNIPYIKYEPLEDKNATISAYKAGDLDITFQSIPVDQFNRIKTEYPKQLHVFLQEGNYFYDFNAHNPDLANNLKLRKALSMAVDREILVKKVLRQGQAPLYSTVTDTIEHGRFNNLHYDWMSWSRESRVADAKKLYQEAGFSVDHPFQVTLAYNTNDLHKKVALAIASMWKQNLGVEVVLLNQEWKTFIQNRHQGDYQIARDGWVADYDSVITYANLYQCNGAQNNSHWCNREYDTLLSQAVLESNIEKQTQLYNKALRIPLDDYAVIPLFQYTIELLVKPRVTNYDADNNHLYHVQSKWMKLTN